MKKIKPLINPFFKYYDNTDSLFDFPIFEKDAYVDFYKSNLLMVYGSMRMTMKNHYRMSESNAVLIGTRTIKEHDLWVNPKNNVCYVKPGLGHVYVEIYQLQDMLDLDYIDQCEGHPWCYTRVLHKNNCWIYVVSDSEYAKRNIKNLIHIHHGDYVKWKREQSPVPIQILPTLKS